VNFFGSVIGGTVGRVTLRALVDHPLLEVLLFSRRAQR
jgi:hypothetical protein